MTDEEKELERKKQLKQMEGESKLQSALKHQLGILTVGNNIIRDLIYNAERYDVSIVHLSEMQNEMNFLLSCIDEMKEWIRMFHEDGRTDFYATRQQQKEAEQQ